jgi:hypothetical protein
LAFGSLIRSRRKALKMRQNQLAQNASGAAASALRARPAHIG